MKKQIWTYSFQQERGCYPALAVTVIPPAEEAEPAEAMRRESGVEASAGVETGAGPAAPVQPAGVVSKKWYAVWVN